MSTEQKAIIKLPLFVKELATTILGEAYCYEEIVERLNFKNVDCLKLGLSKGLGLVIVAGGCIVKIPQIIKIIKAKSAKGISLLSYILETFSYIISIVYNLRSENPFSTWGETLAITFQNAFILLLILYYNGSLFTASILLAAAAIFYTTLNNPTIVDSELLQLLQACTIPVVLISRIPQIISNYKNGHTGHLSAFAIFNYFFGTLARVFTTIQEVDDKIILTSYLLALFLNTVLAGQMTYYWNAKPVAETKKKQ
ncbi:mannose-P-dolichol utilization defect 1 protein [Neoconidiobolus thromboides FSU 785]|nr:mannose-P-dolichol utilization defect 1 protein [Neoconidiobolus thromboides FSU 785]